MRGRASGMLVAPEGRMSSPVRTSMADGVFHTAVGSLFSVTTWILPSCSSESDLSCLGLSAGWGAFTDEEASPRAKLGDARQQTTIAAKTRREPTGANACSSETQQGKICT